MSTPVCSFATHGGGLPAQSMITPVPSPGADVEAAPEVGRVATLVRTPRCGCRGDEGRYHEALVVAITEPGQPSEKKRRSDGVVGGMSPSPGADVERVSPVPVQMWQRVSPSPGNRAAFG